MMENLFNSRPGNISHVGLAVSYSNPRTLGLLVGLRAFPLKEHEVTGWYVYRAMVDTTLLEVAFAPELAGRRIGKSMYHEVGGFWLWTTNPHFDIRLAGNSGIPGGGYRDLAHLADCNLNVAGVQPCAGNDLTLRGEVREAALEHGHNFCQVVHCLAPSATCLHQPAMGQPWHNSSGQLAM